MAVGLAEVLLILLHQLFLVLDLFIGNCAFGFLLLLTGDVFFGVRHFQI